jgi:hypothetical protein
MEEILVLEYGRAKEIEILQMKNRKLNSKDLLNNKTWSLICR